MITGFVQDLTLVIQRVAPLAPVATIVSAIQHHFAGQVIYVGKSPAPADLKKRNLEIAKELECGTLISDISTDYRLSIRHIKRIAATHKSTAKQITEKTNEL